MALLLKIKIIVHEWYLDCPPKLKLSLGRYLKNEQNSTVISWGDGAWDFCDISDHIYGEDDEFVEEYETIVTVDGSVDISSSLIIRGENITVKEVTIFSNTPYDMMELNDVCQLKIVGNPEIRALILDNFQAKILDLHNCTRVDNIFINGGHTENLLLPIESKDAYIKISSSKNASVMFE